MGTEYTELVIDPQRAIIATISVIVVGLVIFAVRNRKLLKSRLVKDDE